MTLPALRNDTVIARLEAARAALAEADTIQKTKTIADMAHAALVWAQRHKLGKEAVAYAQSVEIEAFRKMGEQLLETDRNEGGRPKTRSDSEQVSAPTLEDLGITRKESSMAQKLAEMPDAQFEEVRAGHKSIGQAIAKVDAARKGTSRPAEPKAEEAKLRAEIIDLQGKYADLLEKHSELADTAQELNDKLQAFETTEPDAQQKLIAELQLKLRRKEAEIDRLRMQIRDANNKNNELIRTVKRLQKNGR